MPGLKCKALAVMLTLGAVGLSPTAALAADDWKVIPASVCQPYGPGTTASELTYNQLGVTNPGVTNESVLCPITTDGEVAWSSTPAPSSAVIYAYYRTGAASGRVACTWFVSNAAVVSGPTYSVTANPGNIAANTRGLIGVVLVDISGDWGRSPPTVALCTLLPKTTLAIFSFQETVSTNVP